MLKRVIDASPRPIREINNEIPDWLCDIIAKLHAKKPEDRFQTAKEVAELLGQRLADVQAGRAMSGEPRAVRPRVKRPPLRRLSIVAPPAPSWWHSAAGIFSVYACLFVAFCAGLFFLCQELLVYPGYIALYIAVGAGSAALMLWTGSLALEPGSARRRLRLIAGFPLFWARACCSLLACSMRSLSATSS